MGIADLNPFIQTNVPGAEITARLDDFRGTRVCVDAINMMYKYMSPVHRDVVNAMNVLNQEINYDYRRGLFVRKYLEFVLMLIYHGITPVLIFDGKNVEGKDEEREKRKKAREKLENDIEDLKKKILSQDAFSRNKKDEELLRQKMCNNSKVKADDIETLKIILRGMGIPVITAKGEADPLAAALAIEGKVSAVISTDRDFLAYACPLVIVEILPECLDVATKKYVRPCKVVKYQNIIEKLQVTPETFVDFCICCGCDYNNKKKLYRINTYNTFELLKLHKTIEELDKKGYDISQLKHVECREKFKYHASSTLSEEPITQLDVDKERVRQSTLRDFMKIYGFERIVDTFSLAYETLVDPPFLATSVPIKKPTIRVVKGITSPIFNLEEKKNVSVAFAPKENAQVEELIRDLDDFL